jgi:hypothetical protein
MSPLSWYIAKYGLEDMTWDGIIGKIPLILRDDLYLVSIPLVTKKTIFDLKDHLERPTNKKIENLTKEEFDAIGPQVSSASMSWNSIYTLCSDDVFLASENSQLIRRATCDLEASYTLLSNGGDTHSAIFHAHAASEKFLKVAFKRAGSSVDVKSFGHRSHKLFQELIAIDSRYSWLKQSVDLLQNLAPNMSIRYKTLLLDLRAATSAIQASIFLCGALSAMWTFEYQRGSRNASFAPGKFYLNGTAYTFYCEKVTSEAVVLFAFEQNDWTGRQAARISISKSFSPLYLAVTDAGQDQLLRIQLLDHIRNLGRELGKGEYELINISSPEGIYGMLRIKRLVVQT